MARQVDDLPAALHPTMRNRSSGFVATASVTFPSNGTSLCESLQNRLRSTSVRARPSDESHAPVRTIFPSR